MSNSIDSNGTHAVSLYIFTILFGSWIAAGPAIAARTPELKFLTPRDLPSLGIQVRLMPDSVEVPQSPPTTFMYRITRGTQSWDEEMYLPRDLWIRSQHAGRWKDDDGNVLTLAAVQSPLPRDFANEHVTREAYQHAVERAERHIKTWTPDMLKAWAADFTGSAVLSAAADRNQPSSMVQLIRFQLAGHPPTHHAFAFRMRRYSIAHYRERRTWFFVLIEANPAVNAGRAARNVYEEFLHRIAPIRIKADSDDGHSSTFQNGRRVLSTQRSDTFEDSRRQVVESIRNLDNWWYVETPNYIFLSDLGLSYRVMIHDLQNDIEHMRNAYEQFLPARVPINAVSVVRVFASGSAYEDYVGSSHRWSGGLWMPSRKELVVKPVDWAGSREQREWIRRVVHHEAFHQYIFYALDRLQTSAWFNEGHAILFENTVIRNRALVTEEDPRLVPVLNTMASNGQLRVADMLRMPYTTFYHADDKTRQEHYAVAWGLVYYLRKGAPLERPARYAQVPDTYLNALWKLKDGDRATEAAFKETGIEQFANDFEAFWSSKTARSAARRNRIFRAYRPARKW